MRVAVIGAGIVGASVAFRLSQGGARVWLLDKSEPASGTTSVSFAWLNANNKTPREYFELNRAGMEEHFRLADELPEVVPGLHRDGNLIQAGGEGLAELGGRVERLRSWGYPAEWLSFSRMEELEPRVSFHDSGPVAFFPGEAWVDAPRLVEILSGRAAETGATVRPGFDVTGIEMGGDHGRVSGVTSASGERIPVDAVVNAAGVGAGRVAGLVGRYLPLSVKNGLLVRAATEDRLLGRLLHTPRVNLRPDGPNHLLLHHGSVDERLSDGNEEHLAEELLGRAREMIPTLADAEAGEVRVGKRPVPEDGLSCVGGVTGLPGYYEAVTHSGVTLGPLIGRLLARGILEERIDPLLAPFQPDRFGG